MLERSACVHWHKDISHKICKKLIKLGKGKWDQAQTLGSGQENKTLTGVRNRDIVWANDQWVYDLIWDYMSTANEQAGWKYNIVAAENCQVTRYTKDGFYTWHKDGMGSHNEVHNEPDNKFLHGNARKLSMSILLNSNYEGGDLEIRGVEANELPSGEGSIIVFPSFIQHRVAPITKGIRYSLVSWFVGPPFI